MVYRFFLAGFMGVKVSKSKSCEYYTNRGHKCDYAWMQGCCKCGWKGPERQSRIRGEKAECYRDWKAHNMEQEEKVSKSKDWEFYTTLESRVMGVVDELERLASSPELPHHSMATELREALMSIPGDDSQETEKPPVFTIQPYKASGMGMRQLVLCCDGVVIPGQRETLLMSTAARDCFPQFTVIFEHFPGVLDYVDTPAIERKG